MTDFGKLLADSFLEETRQQVQGDGRNTSPQDLIELRPTTGVLQKDVQADPGGVCFRHNTSTEVKRESDPSASVCQGVPD
jgi:hypothetical protein